MKLCLRVPAILSKTGCTLPPQYNDAAVKVDEPVPGTKRTTMLTKEQQPASYIQ